MGTYSNCNVTSEANTSIQLITDDKIVISGAKNANRSSNCGPDNRTITGNFVLTFWNCTVIVNSEEFQSYEWKSETEEIQGALHNLFITRQLIKRQDITTISQENIENRKLLNKVYLRQFNHQTWIWTLSGSISVSTILIIILISYICIRSRAKVINITNSNPSPEKISYANLLKEMSNTRKDADALSSPPGGIMVSHK